MCNKEQWQTALRNGATQEKYRGGEGGGKLSGTCLDKGDLRVDNNPNYKA